MIIFSELSVPRKKSPLSHCHLGAIRSCLVYPFPSWLPLKNTLESSPHGGRSGLWPHLIASAGHCAHHFACLLPTSQLLFGVSYSYSLQHICGENMVLKSAVTCSWLQSSSVTMLSIACWCWAGLTSQSKCQSPETEIEGESTQPTDLSSGSQGSLVHTAGILGSAVQSCASSPMG